MLMEKGELAISITLLPSKLRYLLTRRSNFTRQSPRYYLLLFGRSDAKIQALARFTSYLDNPKNVYEYLLREGDAVIFDNRRVLHARAAFEDIDGAPKSDGPNRWLKGVSERVILPLSRWLKRFAVLLRTRYNDG